MFFSGMDVSQGTVATHLRCGGIFYYRFGVKSIGERTVKISQ